jgi:hypothetical protein
MFLDGNMQFLTLSETKNMQLHELLFRLNFMNKCIFTQIPCINQEPGQNTVARLHAGQHRKYGQIPNMHKICLQRIQPNSGVHSDSYSMGTWALPSGVMQPGHKADYSSSPTAAVKKAWSYGSTPPSRHAKEQLHVSMYQLSLKSVKILIPDSLWIYQMFSFLCYTHVVFIHVVTTLFLYHQLADTRLIKQN